MAVTINIPSQVKTYANLAAFPVSGSLKTIYIAEDTNKTYRWDGSTYVEISASAATGLTVGTTPISSGTIGRVLFQGTGNVLQQSSSLFWDSTNNRLGIGTETPANRLELYATGSYNLLPDSNTHLSFRNAVGYQASFNLTSDGLLRFYSASGYVFYSNSSTQIHLGSGLGAYIGSFNDSLKFGTIGGTERMRLVATTGNLLINTTTDAGFRLDVNGTARMGTLRLLNTSDTLEFANTLVRIRRVANTMFLDAFNGFTFFDSTSSLDRVKIFANGNFAINTTTDAGYKLDVNGTARVSGLLTVDNLTGNSVRASFFNTINNAITVFQSFTASGNAAFYNSVSIGTTSTPVASAQLEVLSTTKGFLPPRMTTTQKNAIASPAAGLQVYDTTLNRPCFYDGTTWITL